MVGGTVVVVVAGGTDVVVGGVVVVGVVVVVAGGTDVVVGGVVVVGGTVVPVGDGPGLVVATAVGSSVTRSRTLPTAAVAISTEMSVAATQAAAIPNPRFMPT